MSRVAEPGEEVRGVLARAGFTVVDELDLEPWGSSSHRSHPARWVVAAEDGRSGFVVTGRLYLRKGVVETVDGSSLVDLRGPSATSGRFEELLVRRGVTPRPFVSNAEVADLYERVGAGRSELITALTSVWAGDLVGSLESPESAEPEDLDRVLGVLRELASGVPIEWLLRRLSVGAGS